MNKAEKILITERFDRTVDEVKEIFYTIEKQLKAKERVNYSTAKLANLNNSFKETIESL